LYSQFEDGRELVYDNMRSHRPKSTQTEVNTAAVTALVKNYQQIASRMIAESLNTTKTVANKISLTKVLQQMRPGGLPMTQKQSNRVLNGLVTRPLSKRN
jgi:hypothetical protein